MLACNDYEVIDLGVMIPCEEILRQARERKVDMIGLSGLITPSLDEMVHVARSMEREGFEIPLLIGGATTSARHTAVKIAPAVSRDCHPRQRRFKSVGVVDRLGRADARTELDVQNRAGQERRPRRASASVFSASWSPMPRPSTAASRSTGRRRPSPSPSFLGHADARRDPARTDRAFHRLVPFLHVVGAQGEVSQDLRRPQAGPQARELFDDAQKLLGRIVADKRLTANAVYGFFPANTEGDDIVIYTDESRTEERMRFPTLRQQWERDGQTSFRSLADYVAPRESGIADYLGAFAVTAGLELESLVEQFERDHDDYNSIMSKALADRLAEGLAEMLAQEGPRRLGLRP